ncbi:hypothetical protein B296_00029895 [Ensete ventricosum]|uniref:Uncharacterized protein n=1 Tax=Ensete ventricosum TaxID=4639 RepID=A0A426ZCB0_ENSVE|nr:hypothetical protein B296_00029895 [Ensete ventricosum]
MLKLVGARARFGSIRVRKTANVLEGERASRRSDFEILYDKSHGEVGAAVSGTATDGVASLLVVPTNSSFVLQGGVATLDVLAATTTTTTAAVAVASAVVYGLWLLEFGLLLLTLLACE